MILAVVVALWLSPLGILAACAHGIIRDRRRRERDAARRADADAELAHLLSWTPPKVRVVRDERDHVNEYEWKVWHAPVLHMDELRARRERRQRGDCS